MEMAESGSGVGIEARGSLAPKERTDKSADNDGEVNGEDVIIENHEKAKTVELGFFDSADDLNLHENCDWSSWDDGAAGGDPVWLVKPNGEQMWANCVHCEGRLSFLLQLYAPFDDPEFAHAFHRAIFVFVCRTEGCKGYVKVMRSQLPRNNAFYSSETGQDKERHDSNGVQDEIELGPPFARRFRIATEPEPLKGTKACALCGAQATAMCTACHGANYCCRAHQVEHWPKHKKTCKMLAKVKEQMQKGNTVSEEEAEGDEIIGGFNETDAAVSQAEFGAAAAPNDLMRSKLLAFDEEFDRFQERIARDPAQCIRYCRWPRDDDGDAGPVWVGSSGRLITDPPPCELCGSERKFEFQILPQCLYFLQELNVDFATICVYTCTRSCELSDPRTLTAETPHLQQN